MPLLNAAPCRISSADSPAAREVALASDAASRARARRCSAGPGTPAGYGRHACRGRRADREVASVRLPATPVVTHPRRRGSGPPGRRRTASGTASTCSASRRWRRHSMRDASRSSWTSTASRCSRAAASACSIRSSSARSSSRKRPSPGNRRAEDDTRTEGAARSTPSMRRDSSSIRVATSRELERAGELVLVRGEPHAQAVDLDAELSDLVARGGARAAVVVAARLDLDECVVTSSSRPSSAERSDAHACDTRVISAVSASRSRSMRRDPRR